MVQRILEAIRLMFKPRQSWAIHRDGKVVVQKSRPFQVLGFRGLK